MKHDWPYPRLFAHRGGGSLAPENTLAAIRLGPSLGYRAHEIDVKLSLDGVPMLLHDATLERTTNGKGRAADLAVEALRALDAGGWHSAAFRGEPLAVASRRRRSCCARRTRMANVEIKPTPGFERETGTRGGRSRRASLWAGAAVPPLLLVVLVRGADGREGGRARDPARLAHRRVHRGRLGAPGGARGGVAAHQPQEVRRRRRSPRAARRAATG